jgi:hypothetical protein
MLSVSPRRGGGRYASIKEPKEKKAKSAHKRVPHKEDKAKDKNKKQTAVVEQRGGYNVIFPRLMLVYMENCYTHRKCQCKMTLWPPRVGEAAGARARRRGQRHDRLMLV